MRPQFRPDHSAEEDGSTFQNSASEGVCQWRSAQSRREESLAQLPLSQGLSICEILPEIVYGDCQISSHSSVQVKERL